MNNHKPEEDDRERLAGKPEMAVEQVARDINLNGHQLTSANGTLVLDKRPTHVENNACQFVPKFSCAAIGKSRTKCLQIPLLWFPKQIPKA